jgi:transposase
LEQISQSDPDCIHVVIGDGAGFHHREGLLEDKPIAKNLHILTLPPYSPELNPVEKLWDIAKDSICTTIWETLTDLEEQITSTLKELWERADGFISLFTNSYLRSELNTTTL